MHRQFAVHFTHDAHDISRHKWLTLSHTHTHVITMTGYGFRNTIAIRKDVYDDVKDVCRVPLRSFPIRDFPCGRTQNVALACRLATAMTTMNDDRWRNWSTHTHTHDLIPYSACETHVASRSRYMMYCIASWMQFVPYNGRGAHCTVITRRWTFSFTMECHRWHIWTWKIKCCVVWLVPVQIMQKTRRKG